MSWCLIAYSCTCVHAGLWTLALKQLGAIWWFFVQLALNETCIQLTCRGCGILMGSLGKICHNTGITFSQGRLQHSASFRFIAVKMIVEGGGVSFCFNCLQDYSKFHRIFKYSLNCREIDLISESSNEWEIFVRVLLSCSLAMKDNSCLYFNVHV